MDDLRRTAVIKELPRPFPWPLDGCLGDANPIPGGSSRADEMCVNASIEVDLPIRLFLFIASYSLRACARAVRMGVKQTSSNLLSMCAHRVL